METPIHLATGRWPAHSTKKSLPVGHRVAVEAVEAKIFSMYEKKKNVIVFVRRHTKLLVT